MVAEQKKVLGDVMDALMGAERRRTSALKAKTQDLSDRLKTAAARVGDAADELQASLDGATAAYENPLSRDAAAALRAAAGARDARDRLGAYGADFAVLQDRVLEVNGDLQAAITDGGDFAAAFANNAGACVETNHWFGWS